MRWKTSTISDFDRKTIPNDADAGFTMAMVAIPKAIDLAILAGLIRYLPSTQ
jgi:MFS superfamily sulfate permease-like transporter